MLSEEQSRLKIGQTIIKAIAEHDEAFYEEYIEKYTQYPDEDADHYWIDEGGTSRLNPEECYDDDVDIAEMKAIIDILSYVVTNHHPHKVGVAEE